MLNLITQYFFDAEPSEINAETKFWLFIGYGLPISIITLLTITSLGGY